MALVGPAGALVVLLLVAFPAFPGTPGTYANPDCGFSVRNPRGWDPGTNGLNLFGGDDGAVLAVDAVRPIPAGQGSADALALAAAGEYCLSCLARTLVWMDRMTEGTTTISYTISDNPAKFLGHVRPYYHLAFFIVMPAPSTRSSGAGWTRADLDFYVPKEKLQVLEPVIMDMVRSFRVTEPKKACWPQ